MKNLKAIILDYDGVVAESNLVKTQAFTAFFKKKNAKYLSEIIAYHKEHEGISRRKKIRYYYEQLLKKKISEKQIDCFSNEFSKLVVDQVVEAKKVDGVEEFLKDYSSKYLFFISTGTPTEEIIEILKATNMLEYFEEVYGSPILKEEHIKLIMNKYSLSPGEMIFIGDSMTDIKAAEKMDIKFILRIHDHNKELSLEYNADIIADFIDLRNTKIL